MINLCKIIFSKWTAYSLYLIIALYFIFFHQYLFSPLLALPLHMVAFLLIIKVIVQLANGLRLKFSLQLFQCNLTTREWIALATTSSLINAFLPGNPSLVSKALYLQKRHGLSYQNYVWSTLLLNSINIAVTVILLLFLSPFLPVESPIYIAAIVLFIIITTGSVLFVFSLIIPHRFSNPARALEHIINVLIYRKQLFALIVIADIWLTIAKTIALWVCIYSLGATVPLIFVFFAVAAVTLSSLINITPGNLGVTEAILSGLLIYAGIANDVAVSISVLSRLTSATSQFFLAILTTHSFFSLGYR